MHRSLWTLILPALLIAACAPGAAPDPAPSGPAVTLPPAWTPTPTFTPAPATATATATPGSGFETDRPAVVLPPAEVVPAPAGAPDLAGWQRIDSTTASFWLPPSFEVADLGGFGDLMALMMAGMMEGMMEAFGELAPTTEGPAPTPPSLEELREAMGFDFLIAADEAAEAFVVLIGHPLQGPADLDALMVEAVGSTQGELAVERYEVYEGGRYLSARSTVRVRNSETGLLGAQLVYVFVEGERVWSLTYAADAEDFEALRPLFERSAHSFEAR